MDLVKIFKTLIVLLIVFGIFHSLLRDEDNEPVTHHEHEKEEKDVELED
jgi:hypothetical protein